MALRDRGPESDFRGYFSDTETKLDEGNTAMSRHFERGPLWYALETDWLAGHVDGVSGVVAAVSGPLGGCASD
jgi:hypothetical protein